MKTIATALCFIIVSGCAGWTVNGVRSDKITINHVGGMATSFLMHTAGHLVAAKAMGKDYHLEGQSEIIDDLLTSSQAAWIGRAGYLGALAPGYAAKLLGCKNDFWDGYNLGVVVETVGYPIARNFASGGGDDFEMIDRASNPWAEWGVYSVAALGLLVERK